MAPTRHERERERDRVLEWSLLLEVLFSAVCFVVELCCFDFLMLQLIKHTHSMGPTCRVVLCCLLLLCVCARACPEIGGEREKRKGSGRVRCRDGGGQLPEE